MEADLNPIQKLAKLVDAVSRILNDPDVQATGGAFFAAFDRASERELPTVIDAIETGVKHE